MAELLDSIKSSYRIEEIIKNSGEKISLLTPVFRLSEKLFELLKEASERGVRITVIFRADELEQVEKLLLSELPHIEICHSPDLDARCYFSEKDMIITSMNLHDFHEKKGGDMSISVSRKDDLDLFDKTAELYESIYNSSVKLVSGTAKQEKKQIHGAAYHGFCIRCAMPVTYNPAKPYCRQCMNEKKEETDTQIAGNYCHSCAKKASVSVKSPLCNDCSLA